MDENKVIRPMDFVRLTNIDELNVIKDTKNHIGLVKEVSRDGRMSIIWIGETYSQLAWFKSSELEVVDNLVSILTCGLANFRGDGKESADKFYPMNLCYIMLSDDQLDVVERMKGIIDDMVRLKMIMYIDQDYNLCFLPGDKIEDLTMDETDGFVDTKDVVEFYVENPFVKIKDE